MATRYPSDLIPGDATPATGPVADPTAVRRGGNLNPWQTASSGQAHENEGNNVASEPQGGRGFHAAAMLSPSSQIGVSETGRHDNATPSKVDNADPRASSAPDGRVMSTGSNADS
jgi:hypothetical protein